MKYVITVRGSVPPDLARKLAEAHAQALKHTDKGPAGARRGPVGKEVMS